MRREAQKIKAMNSCETELCGGGTVGKTLGRREKGKRCEQMAKKQKGTVWPWGAPLGADISLPVKLGTHALRLVSDLPPWSIMSLFLCSDL